MASRAEALFAAEAALRSAAIFYADWEHGRAAGGKNEETKTARDSARARLRGAALHYATLADELEPKK